MGPQLIFKKKQQLGNQFEMRRSAADGGRQAVTSGDRVLAACAPDAMKGGASAGLRDRK